MARFYSNEVGTAFRNPGKGWLTYNFQPVTRAGLPFGGPQYPVNTLGHPAHSSVVYSNYWNWRDLEPTEGVFRWDLIDATITYWKARGRKVAFGLTGLGQEWRYTQMPHPDWLMARVNYVEYTAGTFEPDYYDPDFLAAHQAFWEAFAARYYKTSLSAGEEDWTRYIEWVDINTFGWIAEWHSTNYEWPEEWITLRSFFGTGVTNMPVRVDMDRVIVYDLASGDEVVDDTFNRTIVDGWDNADKGGAYFGVAGQGTKFGVDGGVGWMNNDVINQARQMSYRHISLHQPEVRIKFRFDKIPTGANGALGVVARSYRWNAQLTEYTGTLNVTASTGATTGVIQRSSGGSTSTLASGATGVTMTAGTWYWLKFRVSGSSPTTLGLTIWADGAAEPGAPSVTTTDSTADLQAPDYTDLRYQTLKTLVDHHYDAFEDEPLRAGRAIPELNMNGVGSTVGDSYISSKDSAAVDYAFTRGASVVTRGIGLFASHATADALALWDKWVSQGRSFHGEWGSPTGGLVYFPETWDPGSADPNDATSFTYTKDGLDETLEQRGSYLGWWKSRETYSCTNLPDPAYIDTGSTGFPESAVCSGFGGASTGNFDVYPFERIYPGTTDTYNDYFQKNSGYRFYVEDHQFPAQLAAGATFTLTQRWFQRAVAKLYKQFYLRVRLIGLERGMTNKTLATDMTAFSAHSWNDLGPCGPRLTVASFTVPADTGPGWYEVQFAVVDDLGNPAMNLAIDGKVTTGLSDATNDYSWYVIGAMKVT